MVEELSAFRIYREGTDTNEVIQISRNSLLIKKY